MLELNTSVCQTMSVKHWISNTRQYKRVPYFLKVFPGLEEFRALYYSRVNSHSQLHYCTTICTLKQLPPNGNEIKPWYGG